jgi:hypothetical protein
LVALVWFHLYKTNFFGSKKFCSFCLLYFHMLKYRIYGCKVTLVCVNWKLFILLALAKGGRKLEAATA